LAKEVDGIDSMFTLIQGMFHKNRLRDIIRNFIYIPDSSKKNEKIVCRYPQYYAARALYDNIKSPKAKETEKVELTLVLQVAEKVSLCFISQGC
jgi:type I restriction enzyme R subunit